MGNTSCRHALDLRFARGSIIGYHHPLLDLLHGSRGIKPVDVGYTSSFGRFGAKDDAFRALKPGKQCYNVLDALACRRYRKYAHLWFCTPYQYWT